MTECGRKKSLRQISASLDYSIWGYLESIACAKPHESVKLLKKAVKKAWDEMPDELVKRVVDSWPDRLQACVDAEGGHIE